MRGLNAQGNQPREKEVGTFSLNPRLLGRDEGPKPSNGQWFDPYACVMEPSAKRRRMRSGRASRPSEPECILGQNLQALNPTVTRSQGSAGERKGYLWEKPQSTVRTFFIRKQSLKPWEKARKSCYHHPPSHR